MAGRLYAPPGWGRQEQESWRAWTSPDTEAAADALFPTGSGNCPEQVAKPSEHRELMLIRRPDNITHSILFPSRSS